MCKRSVWLKKQENFTDLCELYLKGVLFIVKSSLFACGFLDILKTGTENASY